MIALWKAEYRKTRRRYLLLFVLGISAVALMWALQGKLSEDAREQGWDMLLFQMPLINALILPMMAMLLTSRLGDLEHKNCMLKQLCCIAERGKLYDAKLFYGFGLMLFGILIQWCCIILDGFFRHHFGGSFPAKEYLLLLLFTLAPSTAVYVLQHTVAMCSEKPAVPYIVGIIGEFFGVLSMFLPQYPWLRRGILWGYYGVLMFINQNYDRATRTATYYKVDIDRGGFATIVIVTIVIYLAGRRAFCKKEL